MIISTYIDLIILPERAKDLRCGSGIAADGGSTWQ